MHLGRRLAGLCTGLAGLVAVVALSGCIDTAESAAEPSTFGTVSGVGELPDFDDPGPAPPASADSEPEVTDPTSPAESLPTTPVNQTVGQQTTGNKVLMIGDSLMASISERYGGQACDALVPLDWQVEVDAETGRFIDFGKIVLDKRLSAGWDAAIVFLGNNYGQDKAKYQLWLHNLLLQLAPRPTVLLTVTEYRSQQAEVNEAIRDEASQFDNVTVLDWSAISQEPGLTGDDGLHLTDDGRKRLGYALADTMGTAPVGPGTCLKTSFRNDSAGSPNGPNGGAKAGSKPGKSGTTPATTAKPTTPTTAKPTTPSTQAPAPPSTQAPPPPSTQAPAPPTTPAPTPTTQDPNPVGGNPPPTNP